MKVIQFVSIVPVEGVPHKVLDEVPVEEIPDDLLNKEDGSYGYADQRIYADGKACRLKLVEKED